MGIRFFCPNGHKLNVKEFQAGRRGACPHCNVKLRVPLESTRLSSKEERNPPHGGVRSTTSVPPVSPAMNDPLAGDSEVVWYLRPSSGGLFGPATPAVMREWLVEGRIGADSLVWREGWRDWRIASEIFPQFSRDESIVGRNLDIPVGKHRPVGESQR
jgi:hypothetical protein